MLIRVSISLGMDPGDSIDLENELETIDEFLDFCAEVADEAGLVFPKGYRLGYEEDSNA